MSRLGFRIFLAAFAFPAGVVFAGLLAVSAYAVAEGLELFPELLHSRRVLPFFVLFLLAGGVLGVASAANDPDRQRRARRGRGECLFCGYSLTGNESGVCPECGTRAGCANVRDV